MNIDDAKKKRDELASSMLERIQEFESATGLEVESIDLRRAYMAMTTGTDNRVIEVGLIVRVPS